MRLSYDRFANTTGRRGREIALTNHYNPNYAKEFGEWFSVRRIIPYASFDDLSELDR
jgi:hypothetical protein